jgi:Flp pilus assembly protein TadG
MRGILSLRTVAALCRDRRGNFAVITGVVSVVLMMSAGFAVNIAQVVMTRSNLLNALDSAITSTARDLTTGVIAPRTRAPRWKPFSTPMAAPASLR